MKRMLVIAAVVGLVAAAASVAATRGGSTQGGFLLLPRAAPAGQMTFYGHIKSLKRSGGSDERSKRIKRVQEDYFDKPTAVVRQNPDKSSPPRRLRRGQGASLPTASKETPARVPGHNPRTRGNIQGAAPSSSDAGRVAP